MVNSNRGRITYRLLDIFACRGFKSPFSPNVDP